MDVVGIGTSFFDQLIRVETLPKRDEIADVLATSWQYGGPVSTAMAAVSNLGHSAGIACTVGGTFGEYIVKDLERFKVDTTGVVRVPGTQSPMYLCLADRQTGGRSFVSVMMPNQVGHITLEQLDVDWLKKANWILIADEHPASVEIAKLFHELGREIVLDADATIKDLRSLLPYVNHLLMAESQYCALFGDDENYEKNLRLLRRTQPGMYAVTIVTLGERGMAGIDEYGKFFRQNAYKIDMIDSTGAGDSFHAGYIAARLDGMGTQDACAFASAVSAICCCYLGGRAGLPNRQQVDLFIKTGKTDFKDLIDRADFYRKAPFMD